MHPSRLICLIAAIALVISVFMPWMVIESKSISITGFNTEGTAYGKPGLLNLVIGIIVGLSALVGAKWAIRVSFVLAALNMGWMLRNFMILGYCQAGICPHREMGLYIALLSSIVLLITVAIIPVKKDALSS